MASALYFLAFSGFIFAFSQSVASEISNELNVDRSSVNPLSYTDEARYSRDWTTERPVRSSQRRNDCPAHEHYSRCNANCEKTCDIYKSIPCSRLCIGGCVCNSRLVRGPDRKCIKPKECPTKPQAEAQHNWCEEYEVWDFQYAHCPRNCSNYDDVLRCRKIYVAGCVCDYANGYVRGSNRKCVPIEKCLTKTVINTNSYVTLNPPPYTDDDHHIPETVTKIPSVSEIENSLFEEIPPISHSKPSHHCPPEQQWSVCGSHCQRNCSNKDEKDIYCRPVCIPGCICKEGWVKGPHGECIEKDKCPDTSDSEGDPYVTLNPPPYTDDDYLIPESVRKIPRISETENSHFEEIPPFLHSKKKLITVSENNELKVLDNIACPSDSECTISCRQYGHSYGHCTGRNSLVCSCYIENYENAEHEEIETLCPDDKVCDFACKKNMTAKWGVCTGLDNMRCTCYKNGRTFQFKDEFL